MAAIVWKIYWPIEKVVIPEAVAWRCFVKKGGKIKIPIEFTNVFILLSIWNPRIFTRTGTIYLLEQTRANVSNCSKLTINTPE